MTLADPTVTRVDVVGLPTRYPRRVGRNARLGSHGTGGESRVAVIGTDTRHQGWGLAEGPGGDVADVVGRPLSDLIDPATGVRHERHLWLDIALHDLLAVVHDQPVHALLGGRGNRSVEVYDGAIYLDDLDPDDAPRGPAAVLENCRSDAAAGYGGFKLKIGRGHRWMDRAAGDARDVEITRRVREAWPDARILVDANDGYDLEGFCRYLDAVADVGLYWVEEPFPDDAGDLAALRRHRDAVSPATRIAEGETSPDVEALLPVAHRHDIDVLLMDVVSFGLTRWRRLVPRLAGAGVEASPHAWGRPLKTLYAAQMAAGLGGIPIVEGVPGRTDRVDASGYAFVDGHLTVPDRPGFGLPVPRP
ncbi:mandelate racemase/muconate lactonizing enzyme family protein [Pseudonocardia kunmingensis]|uniref:L-alanine-DL-glutamate epimerase-like enolase superfamily enzyme n=1 Tax=Pseudonocardia kunmingensis TaxID=630975 RepID=A0A543D0S8_9PSEU|nr:enolase C-terminal domain-like protein [Pseudonocardia kunmingensis]TQM02932.1 L-alanine-DL-glutamate epimerase-like enolase superfamily enzyme [Pseudonocardia kunmingensis]